MERILLSTLIDWKNSKERMPILLDGARQVGKSFLLEDLFGKIHFERYLVLDFLENPDLAKIFSGQKTIEELVKNIQIQMGIDYNLDTDLLILDEIGECQEAVDSLKYFSQQAPNAYICASGSNIGLLKSYPVGKVEELKLTPMCFEEFVMANDNPHLLEAYQATKRTDVVHNKLWQLYLEYNFVGGMPRAVSTWFDGDKNKMNALLAKVRSVQENLIKGYVKDFGKFSENKKVALQIEAIFKNIPSQLAVEIESSVKRYQFSGVIPKKKGYDDLSGPIEFLVKCGLISKNYSIEGKPKSPLITQISKTRFKLFLLDVGLLNCMLEINYQEIIQQNFEFKGYIAENFVQNEIISLGVNHTYSWKSGRKAEIEFIIKDKSGGIVPVEVKSGSQTQAKSLKEYTTRYDPDLAYKFIGAIGGFREAKLKTLPLYYVRSYINKIR